MAKMLAATAPAAVSLFTGTHGEASFPPRLHAAIERQRALKSEAAQGRCRERGDLPQLAVGEYAPRRVRQLLVDSQLQLSARQEASPGDMSLLESLTLAHVQDQQLRAVALDMALEFRERHERHARSCLRQQLRHAPAAAHVYSQRLGDVSWHGQVETAHHVDKGRTIAALQARVFGHLLSDARMTASLVLVRWEHFEPGVEAQQSLKQTLMQSLRITARQIGAPGRAAEQRIARDYPILDHEAHGVPGVPRGVKHAQPEPS